MTDIGYQSLKKMAFIAVLLFLTSCATLPPDTICIAPADGVKYCLLKPVTLAKLDGSLRLVTIMKASELRHDLLFAVAYHNDSLQLEASSLLGQSLFAIRYDMSGVHVSPAGRFDHPVWLVGMLQLAYLPIRTIYPQLSGVKLEVNNGNRVFSVNGDAVMSITYSPGIETIRLPASGIEVIVHALP